VVNPFGFKVFMVKMHKESLSLTKSLLDHGRAVKKLDSLSFLIALMFIVLLAPWILGFAVREVFASVGGVILGFGCMFGASANIVFTSIIFVFITHPFDVGDRIIVDGETLFVYEIGLFCTSFQRWDSHLVYYPNSALVDRHIVNVRRSGPMIEWIDLILDSSTPTTTLNVLNEKILHLIQSQDSYFDLVYHFSLSTNTGLERKSIPSDKSTTNGTLPFHDVTLRKDDGKPSLPPLSSSHSLTNSACLYGWDLTDCRLLRLGIPLKHKVNFQDGTARMQRHLTFMFALHDILRDLNVRYYPPTLRVSKGHG